MGFLQGAVTTRWSTPSQSRSPPNCGGPASSEQLSPNSLCTYSSVTAGTGDLARAGGGGGSFFDCAAIADAAQITSKARKTRKRETRENDITLLYPRFHP